MYFAFLCLFTYVLLLDFRRPPPYGPGPAEIMLYFWVFTLVLEEIRQVTNHSFWTTFTWSDFNLLFCNSTISIEYVCVTVSSHTSLSRWWCESLQRAQSPWGFKDSWAFHLSAWLPPTEPGQMSMIPYCTDPAEPSSLGHKSPRWDRPSLLFLLLVLSMCLRKTSSWVEPWHRFPKKEPLCHRQPWHVTQPRVACLPPEGRQCHRGPCSYHTCHRRRLETVGLQLFQSDRWSDVRCVKAAQSTNTFHRLLHKLYGLSHMST